MIHPVEDGKGIMKERQINFASPTDVKNIIMSILECHHEVMIQKNRSDKALVIQWMNGKDKADTTDKETVKASNPAPDPAIQVLP